MCMIWIQRLTLISTTLDPQLNLAYLGTPLVSLFVENNFFDQYNPGVINVLRFSVQPWGHQVHFEPRHIHVSFFASEVPPIELNSQSSGTQKTTV